MADHQMICRECGENAALPSDQVMEQLRHLQAHDWLWNGWSIYMCDSCVQLANKAKAVCLEKTLELFRRNNFQTGINDTLAKMTALKEDCPYIQWRNI